MFGLNLSTERQAAVKSKLDALHFNNLTKESFVMLK